MKKRNLRILALLAAVCILAFSLTACAAGSKDSVSPPGAEIDNNAGGVGGKPSEEVKPDGAAGEFDRKIIRTVTMNCETKAYDDAISTVMTALAAHGGYVETSSTSGTGARSVAPVESYGARTATYTLRIPAEKLDAFLEALRADEGIRILSQSMTSNEITGTYYDTQTRLATLEAERASLTAMLEGFTDYSDITSMLQVQERLYNVIEEIEALKTKLALYDSQVALSTVHLTLREVVTYTPEADPTFGERISDAFTSSWADFADGCQSFAVWFVGALPTLLVMAVIAGVIATVLTVVFKKKK